MPAYGKKPPEKKHKMFEAKDFDNEPMFRDYTVKGNNRAVQTTPEDAVNRTNKSDIKHHESNKKKKQHFGKNQSTAKKNRKNPGPMHKGFGDDIRGYGPMMAKRKWHI